MPTQTPAPVAERAHSYPPRIARAVAASSQASAAFWRRSAVAVSSQTLRRSYLAEAHRALQAAADCRRNVRPA